MSTVACSCPEACRGPIYRLRSAPFEQAKGACVKRRIAGRDDAALPGKVERAALPVGDDAARAFDDGGGREEVVGVEPGIDGEVRAPARKAGRMESVAPRRRQARAREAFMGIGLD